MDIERLVDAELRAVFSQLPELPDFSKDLPAARKFLAELMESRRAGIPFNDRVTVMDREVPGPEGSPDVPVRIYAPSSKTGNQPGLLYVHGGGFTKGSAREFDTMYETVVEDVGCVIVSVDYRLAPESPFPAGIEDCYAALLWMVASSEDLGVDPARIAIGGKSAGGALAAGVVLLNRDRDRVKVAFQWLLQSCLDDRHMTPSSNAIVDGRIWNRRLSLLGWKAYLGNNWHGQVSPYAAPSRREDLSGLPPTYMMVGELDLLRDENIDYATRLMQAGVSTELHVFQGAFHGFDNYVPAAQVSVRAVSESVWALKRALCC